MPVSSSNFRNRIKLSRQEMCMISQAISRDFSPRFLGGRSRYAARIQFSARELLDISSQISREFAPGKLNHQSRLVLLAVSPRRLHAYWHVAKQRLEQALKRVEQEQPMTLRIYAQLEPQAKTSEQPNAEQAWLDVAIENKEGHRDIWLPEPVAGSESVHYRAVLGDRRGDQLFTPLVYSNITVAPGTKQALAWGELPNAIAQSIMAAGNPASSSGKSVSGQGK
jgi:hypothetical protein